MGKGRQSFAWGLGSKYERAGRWQDCFLTGGASGIGEAAMTVSEVLDKASREMIAKLSPMNRMGKPKEIADGVVFLALDRASFITGRTLVIDGGFMID